MLSEGPKLVLKFCKNSKKELKNEAIILISRTLLFCDNRLKYGIIEESNIIPIFVDGLK